LQMSWAATHLAGEIAKALGASANELLAVPLKTLKKLRQPNL